MRFNKVLFPEPFNPTMPLIALASKRKEMLLNTGFSLL
jgi:hypothetical protein